MDESNIVRLNGNEIIGDDGEVVVVDTEAKKRPCTGVDETELVRLAGFDAELGERGVRGASAASWSETAVVGHLAVDQSVVCRLNLELWIGAHD